jgi:hypothetical protein
MQLDLNEFSNLVWLTLSLCALVFAWQFIVVPTAQDCFRLRLFEIRRQLFLYMADGNIGPTNPAYTRLRSSINSALRFTERMSFVRLLAMRAMMMRSELSEQEEFRKKSMASLSSDVRGHLERVETSLGQSLLATILLVSPTLWVLLVFLPVAFVAYALWCGLKILANILLNSVVRSLTDRLKCGLKCAMDNICASITRTIIELI